MLEVNYNDRDVKSIIQLTETILTQFYEESIGAFRSSADQGLQSVIIDTYDSAAWECGDG